MHLHFRLSVRTPPMEHHPKGTIAVHSYLGLHFIEMDAVVRNVNINEVPRDHLEPRFSFKLIHHNFGGHQLYLFLSYSHYCNFMLAKVFSTRPIFKRIQPYLLVLANSYFSSPHHHAQNGIVLPTDNFLSDQSDCNAMFYT